MRRLVEQPKDRGATAVFFALTFTLLIGMLGVALDLAAGFSKQQELQNSADAAALAVARDCLDQAMAQDCVGGDETALHYATANTEELTDDDVATHYPQAYAVTVDTDIERDNWFMSVLPGVEKTMAVGASSTVIYGSPVGGNSILPITGAECLFPGGAEGPEFGTVVTFWLPGNGTEDIKAAAGCEDAGYPAGGFGWLAPNEDCESATKLGEDVAIGAPGKSVVTNCDKYAFHDLAQANAVVLIPLYVDTGGTGGGHYNISKYVAFELNFFESATGSFVSYGECPGEKPLWTGNPNTKAYCFAGKFLETMDDPRDFDLGPINGITFIRMIDPKDL